MGVSACGERRRRAEDAAPASSGTDGAEAGRETPEGRRVSHLSEGHGHPGDGVVVRSSLERREDGEVDLVLQVVHDLATFLVHRADALTEEDQAGSAPGGQRRRKATHLRTSFSFTFLFLV